MKVVRRYATAARLADGNPIIQIIGPSGSKMWIVFNGKPTIEDIKKTEVAVLRSGQYCGFVRLEELDRLGNANVAPAGKSISYADAFPTIERKKLDGKKEAATD